MKTCHKVLPLGKMSEGQRGKKKEIVIRDS